MNARWKAGIIAVVALAVAAPALAQDKGKTAAAELEAASKAALQQLYATAPLAKGIGPTAHAILVFPRVKKAGLGIGGQYGEGTLLKKGVAVAYYKTTGASFGLQAGGQKYGYAMFFMNAKALAAAGQRQRLRGRRRPEHRDGRRGHGEDHHDEHAQGRRLRVRVRAEGLDGGPRHPGQQDREDHAGVGTEGIGQAVGSRGTRGAHHACAAALPAASGNALVGTTPMAPPAVKMTLRWFVPLGESRAIAEALHRHMVEARATIGCLGCSVSTDAGRQVGVRYVEEWADEELLQRQLQPDRFAVLAALMERASSPPFVEFSLPGGMRGLDYVEDVRASAP